MKRAPTIHPIRAELTAHPNSEFESAKNLVIYGMVPDITAVSNPNSNPPRAATRV
jgi:hypothetical protein